MNLDFEELEFICPECDEECLMKVIINADESLTALPVQKCPECGESFDLEIWKEFDYDFNYNDDENEYENDEFIENHGFYLNEDDISEDDEGE